MTAAQLPVRISIDPAVCHGQPCVRGRRVPVTVVLDSLAAGMSADEIVEHLPTLEVEDVHAADGYGARLAKQEAPHAVDRSVTVELDEGR